MMIDCILASLDSDKAKFLNQMSAEFGLIYMKGGHKQSHSKNRNAGSLACEC